MRLLWLAFRFLLLMTHTGTQSPVTMKTGQQSPAKRLPTLWLHFRLSSRYVIPTRQSGSRTVGRWRRRRSRVRAVDLISDPKLRHSRTYYKRRPQQLYFPVSWTETLSTHAEFLGGESSRSANRHAHAARRGDAKIFEHVILAILPQR